MNNDLYIPSSIYKSIELASIEDQIFASRRMTGEINWSSTDESLLTSDGVYKNTNKENQNLVLKYVVNINGFTINGSKNVVIEGRNDEQIVNNASNWLEDTWKEGNIKSDLEFPLTDDVGKVDLIWESNNKNIIDDSGKFVNWCVNEDVIFTVSIKMNDYIVQKEL